MCNADEQRDRVFSEAADDDDALVQSDVHFCGLNKTQNHTRRLSSRTYRTDRVGPLERVDRPRS